MKDISRVMVYGFPTDHHQKRLNEGGHASQCNGAPEERTVSTACQTDPWVAECSCAAVEKRSTGTITKELRAQLDCTHDHQYTIESCPYLPQMELMESEISEDHNSLRAQNHTHHSASQNILSITLGEWDGVPKMEKEQAIQQPIQRYTHP